MNKTNYLLIAACLLVVLSSTMAFAAIGQTMAIQGRLTNSTGSLSTGSFNFTYTIWNASSSGTLLWTQWNDNDTDAVSGDCHGAWQSVQEGIFNQYLGSTTGCPLNISFDSEYWLELTVNGSTLTPRHRISSAAYGFRANITEYLGGAIETVATKNLNMGSKNITTIDWLNGIVQLITGGIDLSSNFIKGASWVNATNVNASSKVYATELCIGTDCKSSWAAAVTQLPAGNISNGTFGSNIADTGNYKFPANLNVSGNIYAMNITLGSSTSFFNATHLGVGTASPIGGVLNVVGGALNMTSQKIIGLANGTTSQDAVTYSQLKDVNTSATNTSGAGAANRTAIWTGASTLSYDNNFTWDNTNKRLGIGTTTPTQTLTVIGDLNVTGASYFGTQSFTNIDASGNLVVGKNLTVGGNNLFVDNSTGRVGIGTLSPSTLLHILKSSGESLTSFFTIQNTNNDNYPRVNEFDFTSRLQGTSTDAVMAYIQGGRSWDVSSQDNSWLSLGARNSTGSTVDVLTVQSGNKMSLLPNGGNVGIGTASPVQLLDIRGSTTDTAGMLTLSASNAAYFVGLLSGRTGDQIERLQFDNASTRLDIGTSTANTFADVKPLVSILSGGNVGINTTSPSAILDVQGSQFTGVRFDLGTIGVSKIILANVVGHTQEGYVLYDTNDNHMAFGGYDVGSTTNKEKVRIDQNGNVGINTTTPTGGALNIVGGALNMTAQKIIELANGTANQDAVAYSQLLAVNASTVRGSGTEDEVAIWSAGDTLSSDSDLKWSSSYNSLVVGPANVSGSNFDIASTMSTTMNPGRSGPSCAQNSDTHKIYCFGGATAITTYTDAVFEYVPATNDNTTKSAVLPSARDSLSCVENSATHLIYCFGGNSSGGYLNQIVEYNSTADSITTKSATLPSGRGGLWCAENSDTHKIYCFGGYNGSYINEVFEYVPATNDNTTKSAVLPSARRALSCSEDSSTHLIYCFGGYTGSWLDQSFQYNSTDDSVTTKATMPRKNGGLACAENSASHKIYCFGGYEYVLAGYYTKYILEYTPAGNSFSTKDATLPGNTSGMGCAENSDTHKIYCFGGYFIGPTFRNSIVEYVSFGYHRLEVSGTANIADVAYAEVFSVNETAAAAMDYDGGLRFNIGNTENNETMIFRFGDANHKLSLKYNNTGAYIMPVPGYSSSQITIDSLGDSILLNPSDAGYMQNRVGINTPYPQTSLQIEDDYTKIAMGSVFNKPSIGFNLYYNEGGWWLADGNGTHNGGAALRLDLSGRLGIFTLPSDGGGVNMQAESDIQNLERFSVTGTGRVGINNTNPSALLHVSNNGAFDSFRVDDANGDTTPFVIDQNGNVGIGTASPKSNLQIGGALSASSTLNSTLSLVSNTTQAGVVFASYVSGVSSPQNVGGIFAEGGTSWVSKLHFNVSNGWASPDQEVMTLSGANGVNNVGIGTASPATKLDIEGPIVSGRGQLYVNSTSGHGYVAVDSPNANEAGYIIDNAGAIKWYIYRPGSTNDLEFYDTASRLRIKSGGNVGINTTAPTSLLHINGTSSYGVFRISPLTNGAESSMAFFRDPITTNTALAWVVGGGAWSNVDDFIIGQGGVKLLVENSTGRVGIGGVTAPAQMLDVSGNIKTSGSIITPSNISIGTTAGGGSGISAVAIGDGASALSTDCIALGASTRCNSDYGIAIGIGADALSAGAVSLGVNANNTGLYSTSIGYGADTRSQDAIAIGHGANASGTSGVAIGTSAKVTGSNSYVIGSSITNAIADSFQVGESTAKLHVNLTGNGGVGVLNTVPLALVDIGDSTNTKNILRFRGERAWKFNFTSSGASTEFNLFEESGGKRFNIINVDPPALSVGTSTGQFNAVAVNLSDAAAMGEAAFTVVGNTSLSLRDAATTNGVCHSGANSNVALPITDRRTMVVCSGAPGDIAEYYETQEVEPGDVVVATGDTIEYQSVTLDVNNTVFPGAMVETSIMKKSTEPYQTNVIGIVSTAPYQAFGQDVRSAAKDARPIALIGRAPVKVTTENGPIKPGDLLTTSSKPGYAMVCKDRLKCIGAIIGKALEPLETGDGKILMLVSLQ